MMTTSDHHDILQDDVRIPVNRSVVLRETNKTAIAKAVLSESQSRFFILEVGQQYHEIAIFWVCEHQIKTTHCVLPQMFRS